MASDEQAALAEAMHELMQRTFGERVLPNPGGPGALFSLDYDKRLFRYNYAHPILVSCAGTVGLKLKVACTAGRHDTVGVDLVANCVNDVLVQGAAPLFFLDCVGMGRLEPKVLRELASGVAAGCKEAGCALLGGGTAEMPGAYEQGQYDLAGFVVGVVEKRHLITGRKVRPGDVVVGLPSAGLHASGFALAWRVLFDQAGMRCSDSLAPHGIERTLGEELLRPTRTYVRAVRGVLHRYTVKQVVAGIAHVAGGGLVGSIPRVLPEGCAVQLAPSSWQRPRIFDVIRELGGVPEAEMYRTFNMGIGMVLMIAPSYAESVVRQLRKEGEEPAIIGHVTEGPRQVTIL